MNLWNYDEKRWDEGIGILEEGMMMLTNFSLWPWGYIFLLSTPNILKYEAGGFPMWEINENIFMSSDVSEVYCNIK